MIYQRFYHSHLQLNITRDRKHCCCYCFQYFTAAQTLERCVNDCFKLLTKQMIKIVKNGKTVKCKNYTRKIKSPVAVYAALQSILVPENNGK